MRRGKGCGGGILGGVGGVLKKIEKREEWGGNITKEKKGIQDLFGKQIKGEINMVKKWERRQWGW